MAVLAHGAQHPMLVVENTQRLPLMATSIILLATMVATKTLPGIASSVRMELLVAGLLLPILCPLTGQGIHLLHTMVIFMCSEVRPMVPRPPVLFTTQS